MRLKSLYGAGFEVIFYCARIKTAWCVPGVKDRSPAPLRGGPHLLMHKREKRSYMVNFKEGGDIMDVEQMILKGNKFGEKLGNNRIIPVWEELERLRKEDYNLFIEYLSLYGREFNATVPVELLEKSEDNELAEAFNRGIFTANFLANYHD